LALGTPSELKHLPGVTPPGTRWLEVLCHDAPERVGRLRQRPGVREATLFGVSIHLLVDDRATLADLGLDEPHVTVLEAEPTLEDVFVSLSKEQDRLQAKKT